MPREGRPRRHYLGLAVALVLCGFWASRLSGDPVCCDAYDTMRMAVSFAHGGVMSLDPRPPYTPSMYREPLPVLVDAGMVALSDAVRDRAGLDAYLRGGRVHWIKVQNLLWMLGLCVVAYLAIGQFTGSAVLAIAGAVLAQGVFFLEPTRAWGVDSLYTELPAAMVLMLGSWLLARGAQRAGWVHMGLTGVTFGALALIKASALYVFAGLVPAVAVLWAARGGRAAPRRVAAGLAALVLGWALVVAPWLVRNYLTFGTLRASDRSGVVLWMRAELSEGIWPSRYLGAFYVWTPRVIRPVVGAVTGFGPQDLRRGGRLERLSTFPDSGFLEADRAAMFEGRPDDAVSFAYRSLAELTRLQRQFRAAGVAHPDLAADETLMRRALARMWARPLPSLVMTGPAMWRGAMLTFPVLVVALAWALRRRDDEVLLFCLPTLGLVVFYALLSHFEHRYGVVAMPPAIVAAMVLTARWWSAALGPAPS